MSLILVVIFQLFTQNEIGYRFPLFSKELIYQDSDSIQSRINLVKENGKVKVQGVYIGNNIGALSYKLIIQKKSNGGTSNNTQSGKFQIVPGKKEFILSTSSFNTQTNDEFN